MISCSSLNIVWTKPDIDEEQWEFSRHPDKQEYYQRHGISWADIVAGFDLGELVPYPRSSMIGNIPVSLSYHRYEDYSRYLARAKRGYRKNYSKLEEELQSKGTLTLKAPVLLSAGGEALLFSGYRRLCLAWNYGMVPYVWLTPLQSTNNR